MKPNDDSLDCGQDRSGRHSEDILDYATLRDANGSIIFMGPHAHRDEVTNSAIAEGEKTVGRCKAGYDLLEHRHRFAVWAAARATQRRFTSTYNLQIAIKKCGIRSIVNDPEALKVDGVGFETLHRRWCSSICATLQSIRPEINVTYGRAAKLVAVYLKTMILMGTNWNTPFGRNMHPPIDRILLRCLSRSKQIKSPFKAEWRSINWTMLADTDYYKLIAQLRQVIPSDWPFWMLEEFWQPAKVDEEEF